MRIQKILVTVFLSLVLVLGTQTPVAENSVAAAHVAQARAYAGNQFSDSLFICEGNASIATAILQGRSNWLPPTRAFDNLFYVGNGFVGVWVLRTSAGLVLFDAGESAKDVTDRVFPGMRQLGLDPEDIRYVLITHAHWDHYGGAKYIQEHFPARIGLTGPDWDLLESSTPGSLERAPNFADDREDRLPPQRDLVIRDGHQLRLGDTSISLYISPGHTPGTLSAIIPVQDGNNSYKLSLLGGTALPPSLERSGRMGGLLEFRESVERLAQLSKRAGAVGLLNTHVFVDGSLARLQAARERGPGEPNPFVLGADAVTRYYAMFTECLRAAAARIQ